MKTECLRPTGPNILIQFPKEAAQVEKGILVPTNSHATTREALVISLGAGASSEDGKRLPFAVAVGDRVLLPTSSGTPVNFDGGRYAMVIEDDLLAILG